MIQYEEKPTPEFDVHGDVGVMSIFDECIEWDRGRSRAGYGMVWSSGEKCMVYVHRLVYEENHGPIPPGACVLHRCDNPPCINVDHLFLGTRTDNVRDMMDKGRGGGQFQKQTHCKRGHSLDDAYVTRTGVRTCRECGRIRLRERYKSNPSKNIKAAREWQARNKHRRQKVDGKWKYV